MGRILFIVLAGLSFSNLYADQKQFYYERFLKSQNANISSAWSSAEVKPRWFSQKIDHANPTDFRTFDQRYFINSAYAEGPDSPVFYYICGEATCDGSDLNRFEDYAKTFKAHLVALEHRYYGYSQPFPLLTVENLKYLTTRMALDDLALFQTYAMYILGMKGPWIVIGGSYAGSLAAYYRSKYPDLVVGALSSSGPVRAKADFEEYDLHVSTVAGPECRAIMKTAVRQVEDSLGDKDRMKEIKKMFGAEEVESDIDFLYVMADMSAIAIQYGYRDTFCGILTESEPLKSYAKAGKKMFEMFGITPVEDSTQGAMSLDPKDYLKSFGMRAWLYQVCTEYGYYQVAYHDEELSARSSHINLDYHYGMCKKLFGIDKRVPTEDTNRTYYEPLLKPNVSRIFFTNGSTDPWSKLSITSEAHDGINSNINLFTMQGASHCSDLGKSDNPDVKKAKQMFTDLMAAWLK